MNPAELHDRSDLRGLLRRWDDQQAAYIAAREQRFAAMLDALALQVEASTGSGFRVVDLACGPGSLTVRVLDRFPRARVVGIDLDPALLAVAHAGTATYGDRVALLDADVADDAWVEAASARLGGRPHAVVSTTALHWLSPDELVRAYGTAHTALPTGGLLLDGDHLRYDSRTPHLRRWAALHDERTQAAAFEEGAEAWDAWWAALEQLPGMKDLVEERHRRFAGRAPSASTAVDFRLATLAQAGFEESGTLWQLFDDFVVYGVA
ncbi:class I SAM-dependent methyltransferase [Nocardioides zeae]|uniref:Class I SAM-dependent methyltransferase n=1 Tax=Nocardioides imazamoxiresistens TaxID=3231893 RepID=A0ABU3Q0B6_9ACTN|nr:class I SAM-dependent methyltransferase [Nocardioides zeae]MDT9594952.1 class I SAM-dependent methyltransferase [Nocardioides zeae]